MNSSNPWAPPTAPLVNLAPRRSPFAKAMGMGALVLTVLAGTALALAHWTPADALGKAFGPTLIGHGFAAFFFLTVVLVMRVSEATSALSRGLRCLPLVPLAAAYMGATGQWLLPRPVVPLLLPFALATFMADAPRTPGPTEKRRPVLLVSAYGILATVLDASRNSPTDEVVALCMLAALLLAVVSVALAIRIAWWSTSPTVRWAMVFFAQGTLLRAFVGMLAVDVHLADTLLVSGQVHFEFFALVAMAAPSGRQGNTWARSLSIAVAGIGAELLALSHVVTGFAGMPRKYQQYLPEFQTGQRVAALGALIAALGLFACIAHILGRRAHGPEEFDPAHEKSSSP